MSENTPTPTAAKVIREGLRISDARVLDVVVGQGSGPGVGLFVTVGNLLDEIGRLNREVRGVRDSLTERDQACDDAEATAAMYRSRLRVLEAIRQRSSAGWAPDRHVGMWYLPDVGEPRYEDMEPGVAGVLWPDEETQ